MTGPDSDYATTLPACSMPRRLAAIFYDALLLLSVWFLATLALMPLTGGQAIRSGNLLYDLYIAGLAWGYFAWSWVRGGQTLGMRAWRVRLVNSDGSAPGWRRASLRFLISIVSWLVLALGFAWALFDRQRLALHDRASGTRLVVLP